MAKIFEEAKSGDMPPLQYRLLHWNAQAFQERCEDAVDAGQECGWK